MHEEEHKITVTVTATKCGREGCDCEQLEDSYTGAIQEVLQLVHDESFGRDERILDIIAEQTAVIAKLYQVIELMATPGYQVEFVPEGDSGIGKLN